MQTLKKLSLALLLSMAFLNVSTAQVAPNPAATIKFDDAPAKTVFIKHPAANDVATFFSTNTVFNFYVYKSGGKADMIKIVNTIRADQDVESCSEGAITGDYQELHVTLKSAKDKMYFVSLFKKAGMNNAKINNNKVTEVDKM